MPHPWGSTVTPEIAIAFLVGLVAGVVITYLLLRRSSVSLARGQFAKWRAEELRRIRQHELESGRAALKRRVADDLAPDIATFPFAAADARFLGNPVHYVVFDGHTDVKDRSADTLRGIVFLSVGDAGAESSPDGLQLVSDCIDKGRVRWMTLSMPRTAAR